MFHLLTSFLLWMLVCFPLSGTSQIEKPEPDYFSDIETEPTALQKFDSLEWTRLTKDLDYGTIESEKEPETTNSKTPKESSEGLATLLKILLIGGGIGMLVFLLSKYFSGKELGSGASKKEALQLQIEIDELKKELPGSTLDPVLVRAENSANYRLAIRLRYLMIIQELNEKEFIEWKKDKTNGQYSRELSGTQLEKPFRQVTQIFEPLWYGQEVLDKSAYQLLSREFEDLEAVLQQSEPMPA
ncbi:MAG: DUF4129 domain-containing protein [Saprospiraceae bacterium]|nr:DUF4129 domain-containing protein [Saprospiraceae bacterium]